jgi:hypothetical protein
VLLAHSRILAGRGRRGRIPRPVAERERQGIPAKVDDAETLLRIARIVDS